jgi:hypothetical protein
MVILLIVSITLNLILGFGIINTLRKLEKFEDANENLLYFFDRLQTGLINVLDQIKTVDLRGAFEADDEVGIVFKGIKGMVESLKVFTQQEQNGS